MKKEIKNQIFPLERALYNIQNVVIRNCEFKGVEDGESALKEASNIEVYDSLFDLRYPLWHNNNACLNNITMTNNCRAALWYDNNIIIKDSKLHGIKALRECSNICIDNSNIVSNEFSWKNNNIKITNSYVESEYAFFNSKNISLKNVEFKGKYSFQYVSDSIIRNSKLDTKDAFWHAKNMTVYDSYIKGEYLAWYSENLRLVNCTIEGTQPLCYAKGLVLENCKMINCDLSFEYSDVNATLIGEVDSIKNPISGKIVYEEVDKIILEDSKYPLNCEIIKK